MYIQDPKIFSTQNLMLVRPKILNPSMARKAGLEQISCSYIKRSQWSSYLVIFCTTTWCKCASENV